MLQLERERLRTSSGHDRRRIRRRRSLSWVLALVALAIVLALLIGGLADIPSASRSYQRSANRSYASLASVVGSSSTETGSQLTRYLPTTPGQKRAQLQNQLNTLVAAANAEYSAARSLPVPPASSAGADFVAAMKDRASAMSDVRATLSGLLGMPVGAAPGSGSVAPTLTEAEAEARLGRAGQLLGRSDQEYAAFRHAMASSAGRAKVPSSRWVVNPRAWSATGVADLVGALAGAPSLQVVHRVALAPNGIRLTPPAVPPGAQPTGGTGVPAGASVVPPTRTLGVDAVVTNSGTVGENHVSVTASLTGGPANKAVSSTAKVSVSAGDSAVAALPPLRVTPGQAYTLTVSVSPAPGQRDRSGLAATFSLWVAPATSTAG